MVYELKYLKFDERSILVEWPKIISENILNDILFFKKAIQHKYIKQKVEVIVAYNSLCVIYGFCIDNFNSEVFTLKSIYSSKKHNENCNAKIWEIPVCYDGEFARDLEVFSKVKKLSKSEIIKIHTNPIYTVFFIGFLPGFLYLGGLDSRLFLDRKSNPVLNVKKGSVAIGGNQTGIYPQTSPGGWHIIGNSPVEIFNPNVTPPCQIKAGDRLKFVAIDKAEYDSVLNQVEESEFRLKTLQ